MANPFAPPNAVSGYDADPPSDDGQQTTNNQISWAKHKTKLTDPLKTYLEALGTAVNTAFATVDNASNLTQGKLPDARLSSNVPLKDAAVSLASSLSVGTTLSVTGAATFSSTIAVTSNASVSGNLTLTGTLNSIAVTDFARLSQSQEFLAFQYVKRTDNAGLGFWNTDATAGQQRWDFYATGDGLTFTAVNDAGSSDNAWLTVSRTGTDIDVVNFPDGTLQYGGNEVAIDSAVVHDTGDETVAGTKTFSSRPQSSSAGGFLSHASGTNTGGSVTLSTSVASGTPAAGDIWVQHEA